MDQSDISSFTWLHLIENNSKMKKDNVVDDVLCPILTQKTQLCAKGGIKH